MMGKAADSDVLGAGEGIMVGDETAAGVAATGKEADVHRLAARLAGLELDAGTLEMVMAALAVDVCDQIDGADA